MPDFIWRTIEFIGIAYGSLIAVISLAILGMIITICIAIWREGI